jgi:quinoprotein glucose dehydrogenase
MTPATTVSPASPRAFASLLLAATPLVARQQEPYVPRIEGASEEAAQAAQKFVPAEGLRVELFAAEPRLANPVAFHVGHDGTVFVAETFRHHQGVTDIRSHMDWLDDDLASRTVEDRRAMFRKFEGANYDPGYGRAFDQVRRIVDRDGDSVSDEDTVFATGFADHAAGIGAGVLSYDGSVYYTCIPDLWRLRDADGDGRAEDQTRLSSGYGVHVALLGHDLHGLRIGPDRRLYFSCGDRGFHVETPEGVIAHPQCGAVLRCELDGSKLEVWHTGLRNPQELAFDELGNLWTGDNNSDGGDRARWVNVVEGGDSGWRYAYQWITAPVARGPWNDEKLWHPWHDGQAAYLVPPIANLADGPSGLTYYPGTGLTSAYDKHFFLCDFRGDASSSGIHTFTVEPKGAFWELGPVSRFLWGALVTDCDFGPDGALWFSDWVYGWEQTGKGRLYRALDPAAQASALVAETQALLAKGMAGRTEDELFELLGHPDQRVRQEAHFALGDSPAPATFGRLGALALDESRPFHARLHALWALWVGARRGVDAWGPIVALAGGGGANGGGNGELRAQALRVLGDLRLANANAARAVSAGLMDPEPRVRFFAALAAGRIGLPTVLSGLRQVLVDAGRTDPNLRHAAVMGLDGCASTAELDRLAADPSSDVRLGVLLALRRRVAWSGFAPVRARASEEARRHAELSIARFLLDEDPRLVLEAARAIHDVPMEGALESLARARLDEKSLAIGGPFVNRVLNANYRLARADTLASLAAREDLALEARVEALFMLASWAHPGNRDRVTNQWRPLAPRSIAELPPLAERLAAGPVLAGPDALVEAFAFFSGAARATGVSDELAALVADRKRVSNVKCIALEALEVMAAPNLVATVRTALGDVDGRVRATALERLERIAPAEVLASAPELVASGEIAERRAAYRILAHHSEPESAALLGAELARLEQELVPSELALDLVSACKQQGAPELRARLARRADRRSSDPQLEPWLDGLFGGDPDRGSDVFQRVELSCTRCHAWWADASERVGPNLFGVGQRLTRLQILESIVGPNRRTTPGFGARAFFLKDGRVVSGRVYEESESLVRLFDPQNNPLALERAEIDEERADLSAMPEDLAKTIAPVDMRDLIAYLARL